MAFRRVYSRAVAIVTALFAIAAAQAPIQDWSNVETVVVTPQGAGPALWHIATPTSEMWILPTVGPTPKDLTWDSTFVAALMKGANVVLLPPRAEAGVFETMWFLMTGLDTIEQPDGTKLENTLPQPLKSRFVATRQRIGRDADRYEDFLGGVAALRLESDYLNFAKLSPDALLKSVQSVASHAGVPARPIATYPAMDVVHDVPKMTPAAHLACIGFALTDIDNATAHAAAAAKAWAVGDIAGVKAHYFETRLDDCLQQNGAYATLREKANRDMTDAIIAALKKPGKSIAVMPMGFFLRKGGVLDRLEAAGLTVSGPGG
ncbi:MAG TPA: TraB/GumN family protein [Rhizomicrobium sp.]|nr:TraB/GumN family protein [Rhizomicrobium sp.]